MIGLWWLRIFLCWCSYLWNVNLAVLRIFFFPICFDGDIFLSCLLFFFRTGLTISTPSTTQRPAETCATSEDIFNVLLKSYISNIIIIIILSELLRKSFCILFLVNGQRCRIRDKKMLHKAIFENNETSTAQRCFWLVKCLWLIC